jgi:cardiolipin synthase
MGIGTVVKVQLISLVMSTGQQIPSLSPSLNSGNSTDLDSVVFENRWAQFRFAPNLLTLLRICLAPYLVLAVVQRRFELALGLFIVAACTDAMDGLLARWLRQRTWIGQYLDPIADKLLLSSLFLVLTGMGILDPRVTVIVFGRDLGMMLTAVILFRIVHLRDFHPSLLGKANSVSQVGAIGVVLLSLNLQQPWILTMREVMLDATVGLTVASGFHYALVASRRIGEVVNAQAAEIAKRSR